MLFARVFVFAAICYQNVICEKRLCDFEDTECLLKGAKRTYQECALGYNKEIPSSEPLFLEEIAGDLPTIKYKLDNVTLAGMSNCTPELVKINSNDQTYVYHVACKHLTLDGQYEVNGYLKTMFVEGKGYHKVDFYDYVFLFNGECEQFLDQDHKLHVLIKNFKLDVDARGGIEFDYKNLYNGDAEKSAALLKYINENWKEMDKLARGPVVEKFMELFIKNVNVYLTVFPIDHVFSYED